MQTGQLPGVFLSIIDFKFFAHFNICPPIIRSSSIFTIPNNVLSSIFQFWLYSDCIEHLFDCQCDSFIFWLGIFNYKLSWSQNMTMNTLFSKLYIFKQYQCLPEYLSHMHLHSNLVIFKWTQCSAFWCTNVLYIPIWLYSNPFDCCRPSQTYPPLHSNLVIFKFTVIQVHYDTMISLHSNLVIFKYKKDYYQKITAIDFTFQSGYIQMPTYPHIFVLDCTLHSNLVIFKFLILWLI